MVTRDSQKALKSFCGAMLHTLKTYGHIMDMHWEPFCHHSEMIDEHWIFCIEKFNRAGFIIRTKAFLVIYLHDDFDSVNRIVEFVRLK